MATLPRAIEPTSGSSIISGNDACPRSDAPFDAGINSSGAWTEHLECCSLSDDELEPTDGHHELQPIEEIVKPARALYDFEGKAEFKELTVEAGDELNILKEEVGDGWSLVRASSGEIGLLPQTYYTCTTSFLSVPLAVHGRKQPSTSTITPQACPQEQSKSLSIVPQDTGEWTNPLPSFRQSLLRGKSLNRFSGFVTSGAEEWVLEGHVDPVASSSSISHQRISTEDSINDDNRLSRLGLGEADRHYIDAGPTWQPKVPKFRVLVHSPSKRTSGLSGAYTVYSVTSLFSSTTDESYDSCIPPIPPTRITVQRRFSHFIVLHTSLTRRLPGIALPPLPEKQYAGRFSADFVEARRGELERYIGCIVKHPVARYAEVVTSFLGCESDVEWKRLMPQFLSMPAAGPSFFAHVFHPAFNVDVDDATEAIVRFSRHTLVVGKGTQSLRNIFGRIREVRLEMSKAERLLSYSLLSLITSTPLSSAPLTGINKDAEDTPPQRNGLLNEEGAWCWRESCQDCLRLTKAMQKTSDSLQIVADLYEDHARRTQLATHEALKNVAHPYQLYEGIIETHQSTVSRYKDTLKSGKVRTLATFSNDEMTARCETVLNTTMAEMDTYHDQKVENFSTIMKEHLDGEINFYEQVLHKLKAARRTFDAPRFDELSRSPRQPSRYERDLEAPKLNPPPLPQPCPHVYDSAPMRPVNTVIHEGIGALMGKSQPGRKGSLLRRMWAE
ncbi:uncharacterized protein BJ212DRAFT_1262371 [Suillus subaureus]|uniref:PX-domain-containing protein n=1 Tax=Suillus subaureus TaxID=48587 RepID=A0A9P7EKL6_9AGAM|nr:uncharacterized protein BJ212DRAFT_1262371 [Suillus subaureus]KAG1823450.1 hypothetical protein BJ212DRAFT_1262371 [Suillus subaureus]